MRTLLLSQLEDFSWREGGQEYRTHICPAWLMKVRGNVFIGTHLPFITVVMKRYYHEKLVNGGEPLVIDKEAYPR